MISGRKGYIGKWMADTHLRAMKEQIQQKAGEEKNIAKQTYQIKELKDILEQLEQAGFEEVGHLQLKRILREPDNHKGLGGMSGR